MDNKRLIERLMTWQRNDRVHPFTCGNDSSHAILDVFEEDGKVKLFCPDCDYVQNNIPQFMLDEENIFDPLMEYDIMEVLRKNGFK